MDERISTIMLIVCLLMFLINYCTMDEMDERASRFDSLIQHLESKIITLQNKIKNIENKEGDNE